MFGVYQPDHGEGGGHDGSRRCEIADGPLRLFDPVLGLKQIVEDPARRWTVYAFGRLLDAGPRGLLGLGEALDAGEADPLATLNGSFALVVHLRAKGEVLLVTDRTGSRRLYYGERDGRLWFSSRLARLRGCGFRLRLTDGRLIQYLTFRCVLDGTILEGVDRLPGASVLRWSTGGSSVHRYWGWDFEEDEPPPGESSASSDRMEELSSLWTGAVSRWILPGSDPLLSLSGGLDSRLILVEMLRHLAPGQFRTMTYGTPGSFDYEIARLIASRRGLRHRSFDLSREGDYDRLFSEACLETDGMIDLVNAVNDSHRALGDDQRELVVGYFADSITGRVCLPDVMLDRRLEGRPDRGSATRYLLDRFSMGLWLQVPWLVERPPDWCFEEMVRVLGGEGSGGPRPSLASALARFHCERLAPRFDLLCLGKGDDTIERICPFLDIHWIDFWRRVPPSLRNEGRLYKEFLAWRAPELYALPLRGLRGRGLVEGRRVWDLGLRPNPEIGLVDYEGWLRGGGPFATLIRDLLTAVGDRGILRREAIDRYWDEHQSGSCENTFMLLRAASLEMILRTFG
ncbi:Carboxyethyl-arginine beta-lactam-synthase [Aquisphaera giovannonii]|uniref:asparagine synthase (glutamine-hydrolyzing) n=1 Tax=Aquisphaera giovannonii TaxID=406548 RepID=A0A5B9VXH9_9BACT|nr:asparagine synthase-related protein [Aquisphaera giovannonii]QEH32400.1 Carboxyethyl-arginine beta-lactam-synthase [Aquisphaera giovannonii]